MAQDRRDKKVVQLPWQQVQGARRLSPQLLGRTVLDYEYCHCLAGTDVCGLRLKVVRGWRDTSGWLWGDFQ